MVAAFFRKQNLVTAMPLVEQRTVSAQWYTEVCLTKVLSNCNSTIKGRPSSNFAASWQQSAHTAAETLVFIQRWCPIGLPSILQSGHFVIFICFWNRKNICVVKDMRVQRRRLQPWMVFWVTLWKCLFDKWLFEWHHVLTRVDVTLKSCK